MIPHDAEAERAIIGAALLDHRVIDEVRTMVTREDFYLKRNAQAFAALCALSDEGVPVDEITLAARMLPNPHTAEQKTELARELGDLSLSTPTAANATAYALAVTKTSRQRKLIDLGDKLKAKAQDDPDDAIHLASRELYALADTGRGRMVLNAKQSARDALNELQRLRDKPEDAFGLRWGYEKLDNVLGGSKAGDLVVLAARPAMGKTTLMLNVAANMTKAGAAGLILELEMSTRQLVMKYLASQARVNATDLARGRFSTDDHNRLNHAIGRLAGSRLVFDETPFSTIVDLRLLARKLKTQGQLDFVCIDYLQLMVAARDRGNREQEIAEISRGLKGLAKELSIPIIALAQLNRGVEQRANKRPMMSDLRESGAIEQDADVIAFIYRDEVYDPENTKEPGVAEVIIGKNRHGSTDTVRLKFIKETQRFEDYDGGYKR